MSSVVNEKEGERRVGVVDEDLEDVWREKEEEEEEEMVVVLFEVPVVKLLEHESEDGTSRRRSDGEDHGELTDWGNDEEVLDDELRKFGVVEC